jgi:peptide/nickel transport system substrate-binding protein
LHLALSGVGMALVAACTPGAQPTAPAPTSPAAPAAAATAAPVAKSAAPPAAPQPKIGGRLRYGSLEDISSVDGHMGASVAQDTLWHVFDRLTQYDLQQQPQPQLAEAWDISDNGRQIKLTLRKGVQFHTGRDFTSDDVKYNLLRVRDPKVGALAQVRGQSDWFTTIDLPDKYTVLLGSDQPRPAVFDFLEFFNIVDRVTMEGPDAKTKAVGTGPFVFAEWAQGNHLTLTRNSSFWQSGRPYVDELTMQVVKDPAGIMTQFEAGGLDLVKTPPIQDFVRLKNDPNYQALLEPEGRFYFVGVNTTFKPLDNKMVRQALAYTIDRKRFVDTVSAGIGTVQALPWPPFSPAYEATKANSNGFDLDKAKSLLSAAGVTGLEIDIWPVSLYPELVQFTQILQADLAKIGVKLNIQSSEIALWLDQVVNNKYQGLYATASGQAQLFPDTLITGAPFRPAANNSGFKSDAYAQLVATMTSEPDAAKRKQIYSHLNDVLLDESFVWPISTAPFRIVARSNLRGMNFLLHDAISFIDAWLA